MKAISVLISGLMLTGSAFAAPMDLNEEVVCTVAAGTTMTVSKIGESGSTRLKPGDLVQKGMRIPLSTVALPTLLGFSSPDGTYRGHFFNYRPTGKVSLDEDERVMKFLSSEVEDLSVTADMIITVLNGEWTTPKISGYRVKYAGTEAGVNLILECRR